MGQSASGNANLVLGSVNSIGVEFPWSGSEDLSGRNCVYKSFGFPSHFWSKLHLLIPKSEQVEIEAGGGVCSLRVIAKSVVKYRPIDRAVKYLPINRAAKYIPVCPKEKWIGERVTEVVQTSFSAAVDKMNRVVQSLWKNGKEVIGDVVASPKLLKASKALLVSSCFVAGTVCFIQAADKVFDAFESKRPKEHLLSALKLSAVACLSYYSGYNLLKL